MSIVSKSINPALVIGNGINLYNAADSSSSWGRLLIQMWQEIAESPVELIPRGISLTEFYDALEIENNNHSLQAAFCRGMEEWQPLKHHISIVKWAQRTGMPILTSNFDLNLSRAIPTNKYHFDSRHFTDFYPWKTYFSNKAIEEPSREFAIWHMNGLIDYPRSIRLGLTHYMGSVHRARDLIHRGRVDSLYSSDGRSNWRGNNTWLDVIFNCELIIFGLTLAENEVFLRWLLIERAKYYRQFPRRFHRAHFIYSGDRIPGGQEFFFDKIGIEVNHEKTYGEIYEKLPGL